jgi:hypothetical protein
VRSSPRSGTDGGGPIRPPSTSGLGRCGQLAVMRHFDRLKSEVEERCGFAS